MVRIDWGQDPAFQNGEFFDFVKTISLEAVWEIFEAGKKYAKSMEEQGKFQRLPKKLLGV